MEMPMCSAMSIYILYLGGNFECGPTTQSGTIQFAYISALMHSSMSVSTVNEFVEGFCKTFIGIFKKIWIFLIGKNKYINFIPHCIVL